MWRKTRKPHGVLCKGADPNRNWNYHWMRKKSKQTFVPCSRIYITDGGASNQPCSETFAGPQAFSEPETKSLSEFITSVQSNLIGYIAFHSYSQLMLLSYGDNPMHLENYNELYDIGTLAATNLAKRYGTKFTVGNIAEILCKFTLAVPKPFSYFCLFQTLLLVVAWIGLKELTIFQSRTLLNFVILVAMVSFFLQIKSSQVEKKPWIH